ncbi:MipA/OmpV family protein [Sphingomicrobium sp. XHP0239]|uniref:MipA/OmpV family protein n=1 Tax=Sphingomicrobium maritimum TaxID=3133972 RepID=UPI0031CC3CF6
MRLTLAIIAAATFAAAPAAAQDAPSVGPPPANDGIPEVGDTITIGAGIVYLPDYEGSDDYRFIPAAAFRAEFGDIQIQSRGLRLYADVVPDSDTGLGFTAGPIAGVRFGRGGNIEDPLVDQLPENDTAIELGGFAGLTYKGLTNPYDSLTARVDVTRDVAGAHDSFIVTSAIDFSTPLSLRSFVSLGASMDVVGDGYADAYFDVPDLGPTFAPSLTPFDAEGGVKSYSISLIGAYALGPDIRRGFAVFGLVSRSQLLGDFADSPIVSEAGSAEQWVTGLGIGYSF